MKNYVALPNIKLEMKEIQLRHLNDLKLYFP